MRARSSDEASTEISLDPGMIAAITEAKRSAAEGGIPIGAALVDEEGTILGTGHNQRVQLGSMVRHAELDCLESVGRRAGFAGTTLYSTLMPCFLCAGAVIQFGIPQVVVGESRNFAGAADLLRTHGVVVTDLGLTECEGLLRSFINQSPDVWSEDIGSLR